MSVIDRRRVLSGLVVAAAVSLTGCGFTDPQAPEAKDVRPRLDEAFAGLTGSTVEYSYDTATQGMGFLNMAVATEHTTEDETRQAFEDALLAAANVFGDESGNVRIEARITGPAGELTPDDLDLPFKPSAKQIKDTLGG